MSDWPDAGAAYEHPGGDDARRQRWQDAVEDAQATGKLTVHRSQGAVFYLEGLCPRCAHVMGQVLDFSVVAPTNVSLTTMLEWLEAPATPSTLDVVCNCTEPHEGRPVDATGCGWGRGLDIAVQMPSAGRGWAPTPPG